MATSTCVLNLEDAVDVLCQWAPCGKHGVRGGMNLVPDKQSNGECVNLVV